MTVDTSSNPPEMHDPATPATGVGNGSRNEPEQPRLLGRSRAYTLANLPERLRQWHSPRINRRERLWVTGGSLAIE